MAKGRDVLDFLRPNGGWFIEGNDYEKIQFLECEPLSKTEFEAAFAIVDTLQAEKDLATQNAKMAAKAKLEALGLTLDDLAALGL